MSRSGQACSEGCTAPRQEKATQLPRNCSALYQQRPAPETGDYFKAEWFRTYTSEPPRQTLNIYGGSDYAVTSDSGDYTVHVVIGVDPENRMYLLDLWRGQTSSDIWIEAWCDLVKKWRPSFWAEEHGQIISGVGPFLKRAARRGRASPCGRAWIARARPCRRRTWRNPMPIVPRSRKYRAIIGRRCEAYAPLTSGYNGLVGGSNPLGPTTQSFATGDFLKVYERPRIDGDLCDGSFSETASLQSAGHFCAFFSGPEIPFPETETARGRDSVRMPVTGPIALGRKPWGQLGITYRTNYAVVVRFR